MKSIEMEKLFGKSFTKAIELECKRRDMDLPMFFAYFIHWWADDEFFDYMMKLCEKHKLIIGDDDWSFEEEDMRAVRAFYQAEMN